MDQPATKQKVVTAVTTPESIQKDQRLLPTKMRLKITLYLQLTKFSIFSSRKILEIDGGIINESILKISNDEFVICSTGDGDGQNGAAYRVNLVIKKLFLRLNCWQDRLRDTRYIVYTVYHKSDFFQRNFRMTKIDCQLFEKFILQRTGQKTSLFTENSTVFSASYM